MAQKTGNCFVHQARSVNEFWRQIITRTLWDGSPLIIPHTEIKGSQTDSKTKRSSTYQRTIWHHNNKKPSGWSLFLFIMHSRRPPLCVNDHICCQSLKGKTPFYYFCWQLFITHCKNWSGCQDSSISKHGLPWSLLPASHGKIRTATTSSTDMDHLFCLFNYLFSKSRSAGIDKILQSHPDTRQWIEILRNLLWNADKVSIVSVESQVWGVEACQESLRAFYSSACVTLTCALLAITASKHIERMQGMKIHVSKRRPRPKWQTLCLQSSGQQANSCKKKTKKMTG